MSPKPIMEYEDRIVCLRMSTRAYNYCQKNNIQTISDLIKFYKDNGYKIPNRVAGIGLKTIDELSIICGFFIKGLYAIKQDHLCQSYSQTSQLAHCGLSVRAYNYCCANRLFTVGDLLRFYKDNNQTIPPRQNAGRKTITELEGFCRKQPFLESVQSCEEQTSHDKNIELASETKYAVVAPFDFPSLTLEDKQFGWAHFEANGHFPILWIINQVYNQDLDVLCLFSTTPAIIGNEITSFIDKAKQENVSHTCIKQRYERAVMKLFQVNNNSCGGKSKYWKKLLTKEHCSYLIDSISGEDFITTFDFDKVLKKINAEEHTKFSNLFVLQLISSLSDYYVEGGYNTSNYSTDICLIHNDICNVFDFHGFSHGFDKMLENCDVYTELNIRNYIEDSLYWRAFSYEYIDRVVNVCKSYLLHKYGLYENSIEDIIEIVPRKINWAEVIYSLLSQAPSGLTMDEIIPNLLSQYPGHKITESAIRRALDSDSRIQYQRGVHGKTKFLLAVHDVPNSVRDAIVRKLEVCETPVSLEDIVSFVQIYFPTSSSRSIRTTMTNDGRSRFTQYEDGLWGLSSKSYSDAYKVAEVVSHQGYEERLISLKRFIAEKNRYPDRDSLDSEEASLGRWMERNTDKAEVVSLFEEFGPMLWKSYWSSCEEYVRGHGKKLPTRESNPILYKWYIKAMEDYSKGDLTQEQRKMMLHLAMQIR